MFIGTLAPPLRPSKFNDTIDLIFATHWIYPSQIPVLQADDEKCVNDELSKRPGKQSSKGLIRLSLIDFHELQEITHGKGKKLILQK